ncbi:DNA-formamidopyrimidine glycosylase family protein [Actinosynnema sp. NPDC047251]|uniref:DNA-(apurinic or apyrimidinic site) lyase n=1 Tax=Saccharothrix espanaensis (strain ATCC 51144 / DSM 44229 / JCM 9112 / NBRC 15066 / NRRL 15764) TaxID=1179773 RepID=K0KC47_SACES|nr:DNA-formamidopyrimidine glycosylase family protein [Saccharothrix espanaensis]CCH34173.1 putative DNA glycosylase [Saccharothrix espanaensis DSM 44229]
MPEGDTVYLTGRRLDEALAGRTLVRTDFRHPRLATVDLAGRDVVGVATVGKHILTRFSGDLTLRSHLRMDGSWHLYRPGDRWKRPGHQARVVLEVPDRLAVGFALHDLELVPTGEESRLVGHLGPDLLGPWTAQDEAEAVARLTADPEREVGLALLDQRVLAGVGNVYKSEVCFLLGVSPWTPVSGVDGARAVALSRKLLLANALRPVRNTTGLIGRGRESWVYERAGRPCLRCGTRVRVAEQGEGVQERTSYWCPRCQPGPIA